MSRERDDGGSWEAFLVRLDKAMEEGDDLYDGPVDVSR